MIHTNSSKKRRIIFFKIDCSHFTGRAWSKGKHNVNRISSEKILIMKKESEYREKTYKLKRALIEIGRKYICEECGVSETYNNKKIVLDIDHIDGNCRNNIESNLRFLCPNCHSQTHNYKGKNKH